MSALFHTGVVTEHGGPGRVRFFSFFRGAGYCVVLRRGRGRDGKPVEAPGFRPNITLRGFTLYVRTARSSHAPTWGEPVKWLRLATSANRPIA